MVYIYVSESFNQSVFYVCSQQGHIRPSKKHKNYMSEYTWHHVNIPLKNNNKQTNKTTTKNSQTNKTHKIKNKLKNTTMKGQQSTT